MLSSTLVKKEDLILRCPANQNPAFNNTNFHWTNYYVIEMVKVKNDNWGQRPTSKISAGLQCWMAFLQDQMQASSFYLNETSYIAKILVIVTKNCYDIGMVKFKIGELTSETYFENKHKWVWRPGMGEILQKESS